MNPYQAIIDAIDNFGTSTFDGGIHPEDRVHLANAILESLEVWLPAGALR